jgi:DNA-binding MarR family transcriptional regulator
MQSYKLVHQLLSLVEEFEKKSPEKEIMLADFTGFLLNHLGATGSEQITPDIRFGDAEAEAIRLAYQIDNNIGRLFVYMSRYAKSYIKKTLEGTPLQTAEDFTCLAILLTHKNISKGELISRNIQEKTSGTEVIRRLIAAGLAEQWDDKNDKRGKRIAITQQGRELLYKIFDDMDYVGKMITGNLTFSEKLTLQHLLQKLESFHYGIHEKKLITTKDDLKQIATGRSEY